MTAKVQSYTLTNHGNKKAFKVVCQTADGIKIKRFNPTTTYAIDPNPRQAAEDAARAYAAEINSKGVDKFFDETKLSYGIELYKVARKNQQITRRPRPLSTTQREMDNFHCDQYIAASPLINMNVKDIDKTSLDLLITTCSAKGCSDDKIGRVIDTLKQVIDACINPPLMNNKKIKPLIDYNKLRGAVWSPGKRDVQAVEIPKKEEMEQMIAAASGVYKIMFLAISLTGMRYQEAAALMWDRIGWNSHQITIDHAIKKIDKKRTLVPEPKTAAGVRQIPLPGQLRAALQEWQQNPKADKKFVFGMNGHFMSYSVARDNFNKIKNNSGFTFHGGMHSLRHYYASLLFEWHKKRIISLVELQKYIGHTDWKFTSKQYAKAFDDEEHRFKQLDKIDQFLQN